MASGASPDEHITSNPLSLVYCPVSDAPHLLWDGLTFQRGSHSSTSEPKGPAHPSLLSSVPPPPTAFYARQTPVLISNRTKLAGPSYPQDQPRTFRPISFGLRRLRRLGLDRPDPIDRHDRGGLYGLLGFVGGYSGIGGM